MCVSNYLVGAETSGANRSRDGRNTKVIPPIHPSTCFLRFNTYIVLWKYKISMTIVNLFLVFMH